MRLIDADALYETLIIGDIRETHQFCYPCKKVLEAIDAQPTVEAISRQAAIDALAKELKGVFVEYRDIAEKLIGKLPSAQPEIIRCKDCKHMQEDKIFHQYWCNGREVKPDHFCGYAERRQDGQ